MFMSPNPNDNPDGYMSVWWNAAGDCCQYEDAEDRMVFDRDGAANYTYYAGPDAEPSWKLCAGSGKPDHFLEWN